MPSTIDQERACIAPTGAIPGLDDEHVATGFLPRLGREPWLGVVAAAVWLIGCRGAPDDTPPDDTPPHETASSTQELAGYMGGVEATIDAPWRLEPNTGTGLPYPVIPIVVSIHDAVTQTNPAIRLGQFCELEVIEQSAGGYVDTWLDRALAQEIERSDEWPYDSDVAANHRLCRRWAGDDCVNEYDVGSSAEWHATFLYTPQLQAAGQDVHLIVQVRVADAARNGGGCDPITHAPLLMPGSQIGIDTLVKRQLSGPGLPSDYYMENRLSVHLGDAPLPRFDDGWAYGDLHYHSQGTDNEGESAYAYRPTLQAMRAIGLDFVFATDHASNSGQTTDFKEIFLDNFRASWVPSNVSEFLEQLARSHPIGVETFSNARRDMSTPRWMAMRQWLNDSSGWTPPRPSTGANDEVMKLAGRRGAVRMFLGGEVDVIPEISQAERATGVLYFGRGQRYLWGSSCTDIPDKILTMQEWTNKSECHSADDLIKEAPEGGRYKLKDMQGLGDVSFYARQHMVHLPFDPARVDGFVPSDTSEWGGATRRLYSFDPQSGVHGGVLYDEYEVLHKGYAFLAHPVAGSYGKTLGRLGPDIIPYSDVQLRTAFESSAVLGLQLWNEDNRLRGTHMRDDWKWTASHIYDHVTGSPPSDDSYVQLDDGLAAWDKMLLWGMRPSQTAGLSWLAAGTPRKVFMAGGSDAHGDWNYRREGSVTGVAAAVDTAIGKPRNLVHVGSARPQTVLGSANEPYGTVGQQQVTAALGSGEFAVTDGPALRIAVDVNNNGVIDAGDIPMGGSAARSAASRLLVEWKSTAEFGPVEDIDLYVGATSNVLDYGLVYAPPGHGIYRRGTGHAYIDTNGNPHVELLDGYMSDPTGHLRVTPGASEGMGGTRAINLRADDYVVGQRYAHAGHRVCTPNPLCRKPGFLDECIRDPEFCQPPPPTTYSFDHVSLPDRIVVRAFARTTPKLGGLCSGANPSAPAEHDALLSEGCVERLAFTNPIWFGDLPPPPAVPRPVAPTGLSVAATLDGITVSWQPVGNAVSYTVKRGETPAGPFDLVASGVTATSVTDTNYQGWASYLYVVSAVNTGGESPDSAAVSSSIPPAVPTELMAFPVFNRIFVIWRKAATASGYEVWRGTASCSAPVATPAVPLTLDEGLAAATHYHYCVKATNPAGSSALSSELIAATAAAIPTGLVAVPGDGRVDLSWNAAAGATGYIVTLGDYSSWLRVTTTSYSWLNLVNGTTYSFCVMGSASEDPSGNSECSNLVYATPLPALPATPTGLTSTSMYAAINLTWNAAAGATGYQIWRGDSSCSAAYATSSVPSFTDANVTAGMTRYYCVKATNLAGSSGLSNQVAGALSPVPNTPGNIGVTRSYLGFVVEWDASAGAATYEVWRGTSTCSARVGTTPSTSYQDTGLVSGTRYHYCVRAVSAAGTLGAISSEVSDTATSSVPNGGYCNQPSECASNHCDAGSDRINGSCGGPRKRCRMVQSYECGDCACVDTAGGCGVYLPDGNACTYGVCFMGNCE